MLVAALLATLATAPVHAPVRSDFFSARLIDTPAFVQPALQGSLYGGINQIVSGSILCVVGGAIMGFGLFGLGQAGIQTDEKGALVWTVLGWTFTGIGGVVLLVGLPILIVGIVRVATRDGVAKNLHVSKEGMLAVSF